LAGRRQAGACISQMAEEQPARSRRCRAHAEGAALALGCGKAHVEGAALALGGAGRTLKARRWRQGALGGVRTWIRISLAGALRGLEL
jgi:hypothetical protein